MDRCYISAIIPVYNTKQSLLERMIKSILMQKMSSFEIILIDDGSDEECSKYLDSFKDLDERVYVYHKQNGGVSSARNYGIKYTHGDYITFVDADDYIDENFFEIALKEAEEYDVDILYGAIKFIPESYYNNTQNINKLEFFYDNQIDIVKCCLLKTKQKNFDYIITGSPCGNLYKRDLVEKVKFDEKLNYYEDQIFNLQALDFAKRVLVAPHYFYYYVANQSSAFHSIDYFNFFEIHNNYWNKLYDISRNSNDKIKHSFLLMSLDEIIIFSSKINQNQDLTKDEKIKCIKMGSEHIFINDGVIKLDLFDSSIPFSKKIVLLLLKFKMRNLFRFLISIRKLKCE